jgi:putative ABC transport system substrate-binding protein
MMKRRDLITLLGGAAAVWPLAAYAQQTAAKVRRIGVLTNLASDDPESLSRIGAFLQGLQALGWTDGRNVRIDYRWGAGDPGRNAKYAAELVALAPDVILATGSPTVEPLIRATRTVPIVFVQMTDPVGAGVVESLARPGGNATGFTNAEYGMSGKWLELLKGGERLWFAIPTRPGSASLPPFRQWRHRSGWRCVRSEQAISAKSSARSQHSHASRMER